MKFFPLLMKALVSVGGAAGALLLHALIEVFKGPAPSDVATGLWGILSGIFIFVLNYFVSKIGPTKPVSVPADALPAVNAAVLRSQGNL